MQGAFDQLYLAGRYDECMLEYLSNTPKNFNEYDAYWITKAFFNCLGAERAEAVLAEIGAAGPKIDRLRARILIRLNKYQELRKIFDSRISESPAGSADFAFFIIRELFENDLPEQVVSFVDHCQGVDAPGLQDCFAELGNRRESARNLVWEKVNISPGRCSFRTESEITFVDLEDIPTGQQHGKAMSQVLLTRAPGAGADAAGAVKPNTGRSKHIDYAGKQIQISPLNFPKPLTMIGYGAGASFFSNSDGKGILIGGGGIVIRELSPGMSLADYLVLQSLEKNEEEVVEEQCILLPPVNDTGFFNTLLNGFGPVVVNEQSPNPVPIYVPADEHAVLSNIVRSFFPQLSLRFTRKNVIYRFSKLVVPFVEGRSIDKTYINVFQSLLPPVLEGDGTRLYISRSAAKNRPLLEEPQIEALLSGLGFEIVQLENLSFSEQAQTLSKAALVVAPHGAGLANLVFSKGLRKLVEMMPSSYHVRGFENIAREIGADYLSIYGHSSDSAIDAPWSLDLQIFQSALLEFI
ncbi:glycosyltransferase family 61 protein [Pseudacidovorax intermedius]|uniref:glycosyltransferase family 61 protein n=1 Tax=Pseudacidovorax intermedius TaxID=433924 RepID=UPI0009E9914A|nr:glycosyltransferase family 61 protein [Pseudacidovorax intermedius]